MSHRSAVSALGLATVLLALEPGIVVSGASGAPRASLAAQVAAGEGLTVLVSVDMEGVAGLVDPSQLSASGRDYGLARVLLEEETNAAVRAAFDAGATGVVVVDSHGGKTNVRPDRLDHRAQLITGGPRPLGMIEGIGPDVDAVVFVGYHARAGTAGALADHTYTGAIRGVWLNDLELGEAELAGAVAGHFGAPVVFLSGDRVATEQAAAVFEGVEVAAVKEAIGRSAARGVHPERAREMIYEGVRRGLERRDEIPPFRLDAPVTVDVEVASTAGADQLVFVPGTERVGDTRIRYVAPDVPSAYRFTRLARLLAM